MNWKVHVIQWLEMRAAILSGTFFLTSLEEIKFTRQAFCLRVYHSAVQLRL